MNCSVDGCKNKSHSNGLCSTHRRRERLYGSPLITKNNPPGTWFVALGYIATQVNGEKKFDHIRIAEFVLGRELPDGAVVHHADGNKLNNEKNNLVICPNKAYHNLLHARISAMNKSGSPDKRKCRTCGKYDFVENMTVYVSKTGVSSYWHKRGNSKMGKEKAINIFNAEGKFSDIAKRFEVDPSLVSKIKNGKIWSSEK